MTGKGYTAQELERLLVEFNSGTPPSELETELERPGRGIAQQHRTEENKRTKQYYQRHRTTILQKSKQYHQQDKGRWKMFGKYLGELVSRYDKTKKETARELGIHNTVLSMYLAGSRKPNEKFLMSVSKLFNVSCQTLQDLVTPLGNNKVFEV